MPVEPDVPTSVALAQLLAQAPKEQVTLGWLIDHLQKRAFGLLLLILSVLGLAPGVATIIGLVIAIPAVELMLGRKTPSLPQFLTKRSISTAKFAGAVNRLIPLFRAMETIVRPRFHLPFRTTNELVGLLVFLLAITLFAPFPFNIIPTLVIMLISFSYLQEDGVFLCISFVAAILSLSFTNALVLAALRATGFLHRIWAHT
ncbi:MAG TPA: exopolysaccharide biosynthesis protein [Rhizomicrobium sp.]|jgi:hypothetical protein